MNITKAADYAIRFLVQLVRQGGEGSCREIAEEIKVPFNHLAKLVNTLSRNGYLLTRKGKGGGIKLARDPKKIDLAEVVELIEGPITISDCILHRSSCSFSASCRVRPCWVKIKQQIRQYLSQQKLADLIPA